MSFVTDNQIPRESLKTAPAQGRSQSQSVWKNDWTRVLVHAIVVVLALCLSFAWLDEVICRRLTIEGMQGDFRKMFSLFELFGHGTGVVVTCLLVAYLDADGKSKAQRLFLVCLGTGLATISLKPFFVRMRPSVYLEAFNAGHTATTGISLATPVNHSPALDHGFFHDAIHSFPSGHAAMAFAMAFCLAQFYPRGRWVFTGIAVMVGAQRIVGQAHYISDAVAGACVGVAMAWAITRLTLKR